MIKIFSNNYAKFIIAIVLVSSYAVFGLGRTVSGDIVCTEEYKPICGVNDKTYSNECVATQENNVAIKYQGECWEKADLSSSADCQKDAPVCGVDGITYKNDCTAKEKNVEVAQDGVCALAVDLSNDIINPKILFSFVDEIVRRFFVKASGMSVNLLLRSIKDGDAIDVGQSEAKTATDILPLGVDHGRYLVLFQLGDQKLATLVSIALKSNIDPVYQYVYSGVTGDLKINYEIMGENKFLKIVSYGK